MKKNKTISFIVPTIGRSTLSRSLSSIETYPGDEIIVIRATEPLPNDFGNSNRNKGMDMAMGGYLAFLDDDDVYVPQHREIMARAIAENTHRRPIIFRMKFSDGEVLWKTPEFWPQNFGSPCLLVPNSKSHLSRWPTTGSKKELRLGDFYFMDRLNWSRSYYIWREEIIALVGKPK